MGLFYFLLPLALFWPVTVGGRSLVPFDILYQFEPWRSFAAQMGVGLPHNELLADLVLENYAWKRFILESFQAKELPLWNPYIFGGMPFLADGQHSLLYPFTALFLVLPVWQAYGWFTVLTLAAAGLNMYIFLRVIGADRGPALLGGLVYQGSTFFTVSVVFQMIIAGAAWLPLVLAMVHKLAQKADAGERDPTAFIPWTAVGGVALGLVFLAGHIEIAYYTLIVGSLHGLWHLVHLVRAHRQPTPTVRLALWGILMALTGVLLGAAQLVPLYELVRANFREGSASLSQVLGWAYPPRQIVTFLIPDFWGNPARHTVFDIVSRTWRPIVTRNVMGQTLNYVAWTQGLPSWKNYVEAASYAGILPLLLAGIAAWYRRRDPTVRFFAGLALVSLLFIFGTPLYAVLYYGLPGWKQLHTPFRWVFPYTLAVAVLAGLGWEWVTQRPSRVGVRRLSGLALFAGTGVLLLLALMFAWPAPWLALARKVMAVSELTRVAFNDDPALLVSYQWRNAFWFGLFVLLAGVALLLARRASVPPSRRHAVALAVVALDLYIAAFGFNPAVSPELVRFTPPAVAWLQQQPGVWRFTTLEEPGRPVLTANAGMFYRLHDVRGYDSIILKHYVAFMQQVEEQGQLLYNRISPLFWEGSLDSALLDLLNVRFVVTTLTVDRPGWRLVYDGEVRIYENEDVLPRAFWLPLERARRRPHADIVNDLKSLDPRREVWLDTETVPESAVAPSTVGTGAQGEAWVPASVVRYTPNEVEVQVTAAEPGILVLTDTWFPGWRAFLRPAGGAEEDEREVPVWRANGAFRAVEVPAGTWVVRWRYSPNSVKIGFFASFLGVVLLVLGAAYWMWGRIYQEQPGEHAVRRVAKNSLAPMALQLLNKAVDTVFAAFMARILGPEGVGAYAFAVAIIWYFIIFTNFGLGTLLTREVAKDPRAVSRYVSNTILSRLLLFGVAVPVLLAVIWVWETQFGLSRTTSWAIVLLAVGLIPSNLADVLTAVFRAYEKFEIPALITTVTTLVKVSLGAGVLLAGYGIVGLAASSAVTNLVTFSVLGWLAVRYGLIAPGDTLAGYWRQVRAYWDWRFSRSLLSTAFPLMINDFLSTAFFRMDVAILQPMKGDTVVGWYNVAYKFIDGLVIIPSSFTLALFPVISRYAEGARDALWRATVLSLRWLMFLAIPICVLTTRYADAIIWAFGGSRFLPHSAIALRLLIWFLPFSFINSLVHYVLIAVNQQRYLTRAFLIGVGFNLIANLLLIPRYSYQAAAVNTVLSEIALLIPFYALLRRHVGPIPWFTIWWRPLVAGGIMALPLWIGHLPFFLAIPLSVLLYGGTLVALRTLNQDDWGVLEHLLPAGIHRRLTPLAHLAGLK